MGLKTAEIIFPQPSDPTLVSPGDTALKVDSLIDSLSQGATDFLIFDMQRDFRTQMFRSTWESFDKGSVVGCQNTVGCAQATLICSKEQTFSWQQLATSTSLSDIFAYY